TRFHRSSRNRPVRARPKERGTMWQQGTRKQSFAFVSLSQNWGSVKQAPVLTAKSVLTPLGLRWELGQGYLCAQFGRSITNPHPHACAIPPGHDGAPWEDPYRRRRGERARRAERDPQGRGLYHRDGGRWLQGAREARGIPARRDPHGPQ